MGTKVICIIEGEADLGTGYVYEAIAHAHMYMHRLYKMQDKAIQDRTLDYSPIEWT